MPTQYVPGQPNPYFPKHEFHGIPAFGSFQCVDECKLHHVVGAAANVEKAVAAYILTPERLWGTFQVEAEELVKVNGRFDGNEQERNRRINAAYAKLWLADNRFQWAGLAAFASKQMGCGMLHSTQLSEHSAEELRTAASRSGSNTEFGASSVEPGLIGYGANFMLQRLGFGNLHLFLDIYPLHRFFMERGADDFKNYLATRNNKKYAVHWEVDSKVLPFGFPFEQIRDGFRELDHGEVAKSVRSLAFHEQVNILQKLLYDDAKMQYALKANQLAWVSDFPSGVYEEVKLTLSAQCSAKPGMTAYFPKLARAKLWNSGERMTFVLQAAERFDQLVNRKERAAVESSLKHIAAGGSVE
jgi:hypothetical protein